MSYRIVVQIEEKIDGGWTRIRARAHCPAVLDTIEEAQTCCDDIVSDRLRQILTAAGYDSESIVDDLNELVNDSRRPATEQDEIEAMTLSIKKWCCPGRSDYCGGK